MKFWKLMFLCLLVLLIILLTVNVHSVIQLEHNESTTFSYLDVNESVLISNNISYIAKIEEIMCEADNVLNITTLDLLLESGQVHYIQGPSVGEITCQAPATNPPQECVVDRNLEPGDHFILNNGVCNIDIEVDTTDNNSCEEQKIYLHKENFRVQTTTSGNMKFELQGKSFEIPINNLELFSYEGQVQFECPKELKIDTQAESDALLETCAEFAPFLVNDWLKPVLESCRNDASQCRVESDSCAGDKSALRDTIAQLQTRVEAEQSEANALREVKEEIQAERDKFISKAESKGIILVFSVIWNVISTIGLVFLGFFIWKKGGEW